MKPFTTLAMVFLTLVGLAHLLRLGLGWSVVINGMTVPLWASAVGAAVTLLLSFMLWRENRR